MQFELPPYETPDFSDSRFLKSPVVIFDEALRDGVAPENYHATSIYPEYFQVKKGQWRLLRESRMDSVVVLENDGRLSVKELRHIRAGDRVARGRGENGEQGIFVHTDAFHFPGHVYDKFVFRYRPSRETSFSIDYDQLYSLLRYERREGFIVWVLGPAVVFDRDAREAFVRLIEKGYVHALFAGNALATHDIEGSLFRTALGQDLYTKRFAHLGHYNHLDALNIVRNAGSMQKSIDDKTVQNGIMKSVIEHRIPYVLAGSIRDDGPLPEVVGDVYEAQDRMREIARQATTVIALATQLHSIATGNMVPSYTVSADGTTVRPVFFYIVDMSEFAVSKLANRGSLTARSIITNVQDFIVTVERGLGILSGR